MTAKRKTFEDQNKYDGIIYDLLLEIKHDLGKNTEQTFKINGRLRKAQDDIKLLESEIKPLNEKVFPKTIKQLPPLWRDPQIVKLFTYITVVMIVILFIYAGLRGIEVPKGIL